MDVLKFPPRPGMPPDEYDEIPKAKRKSPGKTGL